MKKLTLIVAFLALLLSAQAGGLLTNANQSAQYIRMLSRNASLGIDAVYFNPAGLIKLEDGWHFAFNNQTIFQTRTITTEAPLNQNEFIGEVSAPFFPSAFAVYKMDNIALSLGFGPNGGGGSADYQDGLPSFEGRIESQINNMLVPALTQLSQIGFNVQSGYDVNINFKGQSVFWGIQLGVSAKINNAISAYGGVRYLPSSNIYTGNIKNISLNVNGELVNAYEFLNTTAPATASALATQASDAASNFSGGATLAASLPPTEPVTNPNLVQLLTAIGQDPATLNNASAQQILTGAAATATSQANTLTETANTLRNVAPDVQDIEVDTEQRGDGWTPIIGINISPSENLNIGLKYEHKTILVLTNDTRKSDAGLGFLEDEKEIRTDIPGIIAAGVDYKFNDRFKASLSYNEYLDKGVDWGKNIYEQKRTIDKNSWEIALGVQYDITDDFAVSIGGMKSTTGVSEQYQSDFSYSNSSTSGAFGFEWKISDEVTLDAGMLYTVYEDATKSFGNYSETYDKENLVFAVGLSYSIF